MSKSETTLKPCPFDGGAARMVEIENGYGSRPMFVIECSVCRVAKQWTNKEKVTHEWSARI
jgi:hypothetical protein